MSGRTAGLIAEKLIAQGLPQQTPAVIISDVSRTTERVWRGTLMAISEGIADIGYDNPVLIAVGDVLAARKMPVASFEEPRVSDQAGLSSSVPLHQQKVC